MRDPTQGAARQRRGYEEEEEEEREAERERADGDLERLRDDRVTLLLPAIGALRLRERLLKSTRRYGNFKNALSRQRMTRRR